MALLSSFENVIKIFCKENNLSYDKLKSFPRCGNRNALFIQRVDKDKVGTGQNTPAEVLLSVVRDDNGNICITKGTNADKYLCI